MNKPFENFTKPSAIIPIPEEDLQKIRALTTEIKINSFKSLPAGWCYGDGVVFIQDTINKALEIVKIANDYNVKTDAFPGVSGEIEIHFYKGEKFKDLGKAYKEKEILEIIISPDVFFYYSVGDNEYIPTSCILELITKWCGQ